MFNLETIRQDFPSINKKINGKEVIYFDSACMTLKPRQVIEAMDTYYNQHPACAGRSVHKFGEAVTKKIKESRKNIASFINANEKEIVFTRNATEGLNLLANSLDLCSGDVILTTDKEHNSNLVPWQLLVKRKGIKHKIFRSNSDGTFNLDNFREAVRGVKIVSMVHTSNLDGVTIPAKEIIKIANEQGALVILDAAQSVAHTKIDVRDLNVDFLVFSGHKMLGPTGTGVLYGRYELLEKLAPFMVGGSTVEYTTYDDYRLLPAPEKFEAGLQDYAGIIGLDAAVKYLDNIGFENINEQEKKLNKYATDEITKIPNIKIIGPADSGLRSSIISFYIEGLDMHKIALMLDNSVNVMVRSGRHCVHSWFDDKDIYNSARVSFYFYNTIEEVNIFIDALKKITAIL